MSLCRCDTGSVPDKNREFAELVGACWHEWDVPALQGQWYTCCKCRIIAEHKWYPDYAADPRLVLEAMRERGMLYDFAANIGYDDTVVCYISVEEILDKTGRLRDLAIEFFKKEGFGKQYKVTGPCEGDCEQRKEA